VVPQGLEEVSLFIDERPGMPISLARLTSLSFVQSSYSADLPPLRPTADLEVFAAAFATRAAFSLLAPSSRTAS